MPEFIPTPEQNAIVSAAVNTDDNLLVVARAGAAKTSTLILIAEALTETPILCLAFNKKIAEEMTERLPSNCQAKTLHGLGFAAWRGFLGGVKIKVNNRKVYQLLRARIDNMAEEEKEQAFAEMSETLQMISAAKSSGYLPDDFKGHWKPLLNDWDFFEGLPMEPSDQQITLIKEVCAQSFRNALKGEIDFDDMILCPALCSVSWPSSPLTLVDETQDLSALNHHVLKKLVRRHRLIAVGDPLQAIYGFRGASTNSMNEMKEKFNMVEYSLTISFRCGRKIIENAHWLAPDMKAPDWAEEGEVRRPAFWDSTELALGDAIICRNNTPLFSMAIQMIEIGLLPEIAGRDIGAPLRKIMKTLGKDNALSLQAIAALEDWKDRELKRARPGAVGLIHDKYQCIRIMLEKTKTLGDAVAFLDHLLARDGRIYLMTGHKAKGLEFDNVFFLDSKLCKIDRDQDANIKYVIETRAKKRLTYVSSDTFEIVDVETEVA